jgi:hypothetical protein
MAVNRNDEFENRFDSGAVDLDNPNISVPLGSLSEEVGEAERLAVQESVTPDEVDPSKANIIDEQNQAEISLNLDPLPLSGFEKTGAQVEDPKSLADMLQSKFKSFNVYGGTPPSTVDASYDPLSLALEQADKIDLSGTKTDAIEEATKDKMNDYGADPYMPDTGLGTLASEGYGYVKGKIRDLYGSYFGDPYAGQNTTTAGATQVRSPSGPMPVGSYLGSGVNLATYATPFGTSLAGQAGGMFSSAGSNFATQGSIGLSSAPPASLAGQGAGSTATSSGASAMKVFGQAASIYGIYDGIKNKDYFSAGTALITLLNPATAIPIAVVNAAKMLFGAWSASNRPKPKFGGAEFKAEKNRLMATEGYGYNGYQPSAGKATVASIADYVNTYVKTFGLQFNGTRWAKAIEADPRLNRYDTMDDSGYRDPSVLARKIFETDGLITGTPTYFGQPITSQEDYKAKMEEFNEYYKKTALERGGLVDAAAVGIDPDTLSNKHNKITFKVSNQVGGGGTGRQYTQRTTGGGRGGGGTTQTGYWQTTGTGGRGGGNRVWVPAAPNVVVDQGYSGTNAYAISYRYEDATPFDMLYKNLVGNFNRGQGGTYY